jgi:hypothetical protein
MGLGAGIFLLAVGAVLAFAIHVTTNGAINVQVVGYILMGAGALGIVLSMVFWSSWGGFSRRRAVESGVGTTTTTVDQP